MLSLSKHGVGFFNGLLELIRHSRCACFPVRACDASALVERPVQAPILNCLGHMRRRQGSGSTVQIGNQMCRGKSLSDRVNFVAVRELSESLVIA
jgi:hypothetical protein